MLGFCDNCKTVLAMNNKNNYEHFIGIEENKITPKTCGCEECEKEGTDWIALRMCLSCGHVGCCDSFVGLHATKHFQRTGHTVTVALPNRPWKWCHVHKQYS